MILDIVVAVALLAWNNSGGAKLFSSWYPHLVSYVGIMISSYLLPHKSDTYPVAIYIPLVYVKICDNNYKLLVAKNLGVTIRNFSEGAPFSSAPVI